MSSNEFNNAEAPVLITELQQEANSVLQLRRFELEQSTKPFRARGFKLKRCQRCLIALHLCVCEIAQKCSLPHRFMLIMYRGESIKPSNTGRLIAEIFNNTIAFQWDRTTINDTLLAELADPNYATYIVFPARYAAPTDKVFDRDAFVKKLEQEITTENKSKPKQFVILDGTWSEAKKMFRKCEYLKNFPVLSLDEINAHEYKLREASREEQLGTVSVALSILQLLGEQKGHQSLLAYTNEFTKRYLSSKARNPQSFNN